MNYGVKGQEFLFFTVQAISLLPTPGSSAPGSFRCEKQKPTINLRMFLPSSNPHFTRMGKQLTRSFPRCSGAGRSLDNRSGPLLLQRHGSVNSHHYGRWPILQTYSHALCPATPAARLHMHGAFCIHELPLRQALGWQQPLATFWPQIYKYTIVVMRFKC